jgi:L-fuculose-phosphate aldolase
MNKTNSKLLTLASQVSKYCVGMEGNISGIVDEETILIKASGSNLSNLSSHDLISFDFKGNQLDNIDKRGSMELSFHIYLLGFDGINFISHTHPINSLRILCGNDSIKEAFSKKRIFPDQVIFNGKESCLVPYAKPGLELTKKIKECVEKFIENNSFFPKLILLENHGIISCGETIEECSIITDICEKSAEIFVGNNVNDLSFLSKKDVYDLTIDKNEKYRQNLIK